MANLIDRKQAINEMEGLPKYFDKTGTLCLNYADVLAVLSEHLPSVEPELIRCNECKWFRKEYGWNCIEYTVCGISPTYHPIRREEDFCSYAERESLPESYKGGK